MINTISVSVKELNKSFYVYHEKESLINTFFKKNSYTYFDAIKNISFDAYSGETIGITGPNGSGKSTLLKILSGTMFKDSGTVNVHGRVSSILELGAGFHPELTGIENIKLNALLLGFTKEKLENKISEIIDFADIGSFIDAKVKTFSTGMYLRLGFSIAIHSDFDILLIDEILAVGDLNFQAKCIGKIREFQNAGKTIIIVSHNRKMLELICNRIYYMERGMLSEYNKKEEILETINNNAIKDTIIPTKKEEFHFENYLKYTTAVKIFEKIMNKDSVFFEFKTNDIDPKIFLKQFEYVLFSEKKLNIINHICGNFTKIPFKSGSFDFVFIPELPIFNNINNPQYFIEEIINITSNYGFFFCLNEEIERRKIEEAVLNFCDNEYSIKDIVIKSRIKEFSERTSDILKNIFKTKNVFYKEFYFCSLSEWAFYTMLTNINYQITNYSNLYRILNSIINVTGFSEGEEKNGMYWKGIFFSKNNVINNSFFSPNNLKIKDVIEKIFITISEIETDKLKFPEERDAMSTFPSIRQKMEELLKREKLI